MAAIDPKYQNLPGIAYDQPDIYESGDLPEADQSNQLEELNSESVEHVQCKPNEAYSKFKGSKLDSSNLDFSDRISQSRRTGYVALPEYEMASSEDRSQESPAQKYHRLQHEIRELADETKKIQDNLKDDEMADKLSPVQLAQQTEFLQQQLADLHLEALLGPDAKVDLSDPEGALQKRLLKQIDAYKQTKASPTKASPTAAAAAAAGNQAAGDHITYELFYKPEQAKFAHTARMADLEQRLERMEAVIGNNPEALSAVTSGIADKGLVAVVSHLKSKIGLFDPEQLELIEGRMISLVGKLNQIAEKKEVIEDGEKQSKVSQLYDLVKKWEVVSENVPHVVDRLTALKELHEQALQFSQALTHLDTSQQQIDTTMKTHADMLQQLKMTFETNMNQIQENTSSLNERLKTINK
ncbi:dynactin subunit 2-like [Tubulanus polymorphus]|uniref:dynactin subunit 2-like n=1 Tax=Tubulanus polymorphus TaxID=672921 RepID=UPI003DA2356B